MDGVGCANEFPETAPLSECVGAALESLVAAHSQGPETTIYADAAAVQTTNASFADGLLGLLHSGPGGGCRARSVRLLGQTDASPGAMADGSHALFLVGAANWPQAAWPAVAQTLRGSAYASCTLCVATPEATWGDVAAAWPPPGDGLRQPLNRSGVVAALEAAMVQGRRGSALDAASVADGAATVATAPLLAAMPLADDLFVMPDTSHIFPALARRDGPDAAGARQQIEQLALNVVSLVRGLGLRGNFYSLGDTARRAARRCAGISQSAGGAGAADGLRDAVVVLVDRTADLVAPMRHGGHLLDDMYRALPTYHAGSGSGSDRLVLARSAPDVEGDDELPDVLPGHSLLGLLRSCQQQGGPDRRPSVDLWETMLMQDKPMALQVLRSGLARGLAATGSDTPVDPELTRGRASAEQLQALVDASRIWRQVMEECGALVEVAQAVASTERVAQDERWKEIEGAEKPLTLVIGGIKDALADARVPGDDGTAAEDEICAVWDQVLAAIPPLVPSMVELTIQANSCASRDELLGYVPGWLWRHTPAPGMILMAASLLAPTDVGVPPGQRLAAEQRLQADFATVCRAVASVCADAPAVQAAADAGRQWARRTMDAACAVAVGEGQRRGLAHWRDLATMAAGGGGAYAGLLARIAADVLGGSSRCADLEHAEQSAALAAAGLLRGFGQRLLSGDRSSPSGAGAGEAARKSSTVVFFVVGGVTFAEAASVAAAARQYAGARRVIVGGTTIASVGSTATAFS
ncbi:hypothetical protein IWQ56_000544 [Coemansia nantahalensis]|nr:hypothetical protein IWQ56_000544 [Coemansia nantahalensis]